MTCALCNINCLISSFSRTIWIFLKSVSTQNKLEMVYISRTPVHWTVSRNILLIHELSHGLESANENAQIIFFFFIKYLVIHILLLLPIKIKKYYNVFALVRTQIKSYLYYLIKCTLDIKKSWREHSGLTAAKFKSIFWLKNHWCLRMYCYNET